MAGIEINLTLLDEAFKKAEKVKIDYFEQYYQSISQRANGLDQRVLNMNNIRSRLSNVLKRMSDLSSYMESLKSYISFVESSVNEAERKIEESVQKYLAGSMVISAGTFMNESQFSSSGTMHGGGGRSLHGGGGRSIDGTMRDITDRMLGDNLFPFAAITGMIGDGAGYLKKNWLDYVSAYGDVSDIGQILGITDEDGALSELVDIIGVNKPLRETVKYINAVSEYADALDKGEYAQAAASAIGIGEDVLIGVVGAGVPGAGMVKDLGENMVYNFADSYGDYRDNPSLRTFGKLAFNSTIKATSDMAFDTGYNIIDKIPGLNMIADYYRENTGGKEGAEAFYDAGSQIVDAVMEESEKSGGFGNFYMEGVELMVDGIKKKTADAYNSVVNGFSSIFHK